MDILLTNGEWLPLTFAFLMGLSMLIYAILDGYDLGVGMLMRGANEEEKDVMISSIGPFWDANETWLVLGVGLLLVAFPAAHGLILGNLYLPVTFMLIGLILRGVAFDFRAKARINHKKAWNHAFFGGSLMATVAQGYMLGAYIVGFEKSLAGIGFCALIGLGLVAGYCLIGAAWLILKTSGPLQRKAIGWARQALWGTLIGIVLVSFATPLVSPRIFHRWFSFPHFILLAPIPLMTGALVVALDIFLRQLPRPHDRWCWVPFASVIGIFILCFHGLAYSFYPYIVPDRLKITEAASAPESLKIILVGVLIVFPVLMAYTFLAYRIFRGKAKELTYD